MQLSGSRWIYTYPVAVELAGKWRKVKPNWQFHFTLWAWQTEPREIPRIQTRFFQRGKWVCRGNFDYRLSKLKHFMLTFSQRPMSYTPNILVADVSTSTTCAGTAWRLNASRVNFGLNWTTKANWLQICWKAKSIRNELLKLLSVCSFLINCYSSFAATNPHSGSARNLYAPGRKWCSSGWWILNGNRWK